MRASPKIGEAAAGHPFNQEPPSPSGGGFFRNDSTNLPGMPAMAKAYARWANASGGINGHELRVLTCNEIGRAHV